MSVLKDLMAKRDAAQKAYDDFVSPIIAEERTLTDDETAKKAELRNKVTELDDRIDEVDASERRNAQLAEVRSRIGADHKPEAVVTEARTYGKGSPNSYYADLVRSAHVGFPGHHEAVGRLNRHSQEIAREIAADSDEGKRAVSQIRNLRRSDSGKDAEHLIAEMRAAGGRGELRAGMDTSSASGGAFVTPAYLTPKYAPYREAGRAFADQCNGMPLPEYGMTIYMPHVTAAATVTTQVGQNQGITETDPNAGYLSANVQTVAGQVNVSQQLLDRAGPNFSFDLMVFDQLSRDLAPKIDAYVLAQSLANAGAITYTDASGFTPAARSLPGTGGFFGKVSGAKAAVRTNAGVVMNPTHLFLQPARWEYISGWADAAGHPLVTPDYAGPNNALAGGSTDGDAGVEGRTGYRLNGLPVFQDLNIPAPGTGVDQGVVGNLNEVYVFEGSPVQRALPQTNANTLSVLLQMYEYIAVLVPYPTAIQAISGSGMSAITF